MDFKTVLQQMSKSLSKHDRNMRQKEMTDFYRLKEALDRTQNSKEILTYLVTELEGMRRASFIARIFGRYKKMLINEMQREVFQWEK